MAKGEDYDEQFAASIGGGDSVPDAYWDLASSDITEALRILRPVFDESAGEDGYVSLEVAPEVARDSAGTETLAARSTSVSTDRTLVRSGHRRGCGIQTGLREAQHQRTLLFGLSATPGDDA